MALIQCEECGQMVSDCAVKCPKCGCSLTRKIPASETRRMRKAQPRKEGQGKNIAIALLSVALVAVLGVCQFLWLRGKDTTNVANENLISERDAAKAEVQTGPVTGTINGHEYVDLGLSVKWATCNVGASTPEEYGDYFALGETSMKSKYTWENLKTSNIRYEGTENIAGNPQYDAACANWGGTWRLPTKDEIIELVDKCTRTWTRQGGHNGYRITGPNGNSIFLPAAGWRFVSSLINAEGFGGYRDATLDYSSSGSGLNFSGGDFRWNLLLDDCKGMSVRPVSD